MKRKYLIMALSLVASGLIMTSCYKSFDPSTYAPAFTINGYSSVNQIKHDNLIDYWAFQGGLSDSVTNVSMTNHGTNYANAFLGKGLDLTVNDKSYSISDPSTALKNLKSFTISFWVKPTFVDKNNDGGIDGILGFVNIANTSDFWGYIDWFIENNSNPASATIKIHFKGTSTADTWVVKNNVTGLFGKWTNHTLTFDAATGMVTYYMNGAVLVPATAVPWTGGVDFSGIGPLVFGCMQFQTNPSLGTAGGAQDWASYLTGGMDEVRIYNAALTDEEVNALVVLQGKSGTH